MGSKRKSSRVLANPASVQPASAAVMQPDSGDRAGARTELPPLDEPAADPLDPEVVRALLAEAGLLGDRPYYPDLPVDPAEIEAMERDDEEWLLATFTEPLGLSEAVIEDRG